MISSSLLTFVANAFFTALIENTADNLIEKVKGDSARRAFQHALGAAIRRYATGSQFAFAAPLLEKNGFLSQPEVAAELTQLVRFQRKPDVRLIGERWRQALNSPSQWNIFTAEAERFLAFLHQELSNTDVFRAVFDSMSLSAIATSTTLSSEHLATIETQLSGLIGLVNSQFRVVNDHFANAKPSIRSHIRDYVSYIEEKTRGFVGRSFIVEEIDSFLVNEHCGYLLIRGDPGIGKTALVAHLVKTRGYIHHFNIRAEGANKPKEFLRSVCAQLIAVYNLDYASLPPEASEAGSFLRKLLDDVSSKLNGQKCVIVIDALDEVDNLELPSGANTLFLPMTLPVGIYMVCTLRRETSINVPLRIDLPEQREILVQQDEEHNIADVREYVVGQTLRARIQAYVLKQKISDEVFIDHMVQKSQGNFIYLRMVFPEIERGAYSDLEFSHIPLGLTSYYEDHWRRMRQQNELDWFTYKLPVVIALTVVKEPVSIELLSRFAGVQDRRRIRAVLADFDQFLYKTEVEFEESKQWRYRWYHSSFFEFIAKKETVADERVSLVAGHKKAADNMWDELFNT